MKDRINVLITGACGVTSRSIVRSLELSDKYKGKCRFIGTDICDLEYGIYEGLYEAVYKVPRFDSADYRSIMNKVIRENDIEYAICVPEPEAAYWCENPFDVKFMRIPSEFCRRVLSKKRLYDCLEGTGLVPVYQIIERDVCPENVKLSYPMWIRDYSEGTTSGMGSLLVEDFDDLAAWIRVNRGIQSFMLSEYLPGRNLACFLMYIRGRLVKYGVAERISYVMSKVAPSKVTGNTSKGCLLNYPAAFEVARRAVEVCCNEIAEPMNGVVVVDMKEDSRGCPMVTEINLRHVAFTSTFASAGLNFTEYQMLYLEGREDEIPRGLTLEFPEDNIMLRDVDGLPIYMENYAELKTGECYPPSVRLA